jgi:tetratricopeptide (TPR) repeat protein
MLSISIFWIGFSIFKVSKTGNMDQKTGKHTAYHFRSNFIIPPESTFLNRSDLIIKIHENLKGTEQIQTLALVGVGGSGKTTLARQYACRQNTGIVWEINAETRETLMASFETLADRLCQTAEEKKIFKELQEVKNIPKKKEKIILWVREKLQLHSNWFLIFDNVEKFTDIQDYFPTEPFMWGRGKIIVTTRDTNIKNNKYSMRTLQIEELSEREKLMLFNKIMNDRRISSLSADQKEEMRKFLKEIPSFPLDVSLATYYLKSTHVSYTQYLEYLKKYNNDFNIIQQNILKEVSDYVRTRYSIVTLSLQQIIETHKDFKDLLILISLLDCHNIPRILLEAYSNSVVIDNFIYHLKKYCFITHELSPSSIFTFSMHLSTQEISLNYLIKTLPLEKSSPQLESIINTLDNYITGAIEQEDFLKMKLLISHCEKLLTHGHLLSNITIASIQGTLGCMYYYLSDYSKSKQLLEESQTTFNKYNSANHGKSGDILVYLGNVYRKLGYYEKARVLLEQSLLAYQKHSIFSAKAARALGYLGVVYRNLGDFKKATHLMEQSFNFYKRTPENKIGYAWISAHLGNTYMILGQYEKARTLLEQSLVIYKNRSKEYVGVGWVLGYLGNVYRKLGHYEKARVLLEQSLLIHRKYFSKNHVYIAASLSYLGNVYKDLRDHTKAKELLEKSLIVYQKTYGKEHIETARVLNNLGQVYLLEGHLEASEQFMKRALAIFQSKKHPESYKPLESLADFYLKKSMQRMTEQSKDFKNQAIDSLKKALEILKIFVPNTSSHIARIQLKLKNLEDA